MVIYFIKKSYTKNGICEIDGDIIINGINYNTYVCN